jgi:hypothetical protein
MGGSHEEFTASEWWLNRWKKRHGIHQMVISGDRPSADHIAAENFIKTFEMLINYNCIVPDQIYTIYETGLNFKMLPQKTLASNQEKSVSGIKVSKEKKRMTVAACSNASGTNKLPLFILLHLRMNVFIFYFLFYSVILRIIRLSLRSVLPSGPSMDGLEGFYYASCTRRNLSRSSRS